MQELTSRDSIELLLQINVTSAVHGDGSSVVSPQSLQDNVIIEEHPVRLILVRFGLPKQNKVDKLESPLTFRVPVISHALQSKVISDKHVPSPVIAVRDGLLSTNKRVRDESPVTSNVVNALPKADI